MHLSDTMRILLPVLLENPTGTQPVKPGRRRTGVLSGHFLEWIGQREDDGAHRMERIKTFMIRYNEEKHNAARYANGQSGDIDHGRTSLSEQIPYGRDKVISKHFDWVSPRFVKDLATI